jgi:hypothetical protein
MTIYYYNKYHNITTITNRKNLEKLRIGSCPISRLHDKTINIRITNRCFKNAENFKYVGMAVINKDYTVFMIKSRVPEIHATI